MNKTIRAGLISALALTFGFSAMAQSPMRATSTLAQYDSGEWIYWGGDSGQTRYAPLNQINAGNVDRLKIAWRWTADDSGSGGSSNFKATPLLADGVLYTPWLEHGMAAIDAGTGETIWTFVPPDVGMGGRGASLAPRSLAYWSDGTTKRLFHNSLDGRLIAVDAETGEAAAEFGNGGWLNVNESLGRNGEVVEGGRSVSPAIVVGDVIVVQTIPPGSRNKEAVPGDIRGFNVRTGELEWTFHMVPRPGEFGYDTWLDGAADYVGNSGTWTMMSADVERNIVYIAGDTPSNDFSGVERPGDGLFAESIVAINTLNGERLWHFQVVHHGIWDYDLPAAPILHDLTMDGETIPALTQLTKQGLIFVFNRVTGEPIWPIEERPVPQGDIPGERYSPTQPFPTNPAPLSNMGFDEDWLIDFTPELRAEALEIISEYRTGPIYTPLVDVEATGLRGTWIYPGYGGGPNWNGGALDPATNIMYVPIRHKPNAAGVTPGDPARTNMAYTQSGNRVVMGPDGLPILKPPYSELVAVDMDTGEHLWRIPIGDADDFVREHPRLQGLGLDFESMGKWDAKPAVVLTEELFFMGESGNLSGGSGGPMFRAYDKTNGDELFEVELPALVTGAPMTYVHEGRQYIVVAVSDRGQPAELVALTLDGESENGSPPAGGVPLGEMPALAAQAVASFEASQAELRLGRQVYSESCAICHGDDGMGTIGPSIMGSADPVAVSLTVAQGQGEMQAMASSLSRAQIEAVGKYVATRFGDL